MLTSLSDERPTPTRMRVNKSRRLNVITMAAIQWIPGLLLFPAGLSVGQVLLFAFGLLSLSSRRIQSKLPSFSSLCLLIAFIACGILVLWSTISAFSVEDPWRVGRPIVAFGLGPFVFVIFSRYLKNSDLDTIIRTMIWSAILVSLASLAAYGFTPLQESIFAGTDRSRAFFRHPNQYAIAISTVAPLSLAWAIFMSKNMIVSFFGVFSIIIGMISSGSKWNAILFVFFAIVFSIIFLFAISSWFKRILFVILVVGFGSLLMFFSWQLGEFFNPRMLVLLREFLSEGEISSVVSRYEIWSLSISEFISDPIFGQGAGQYLATPGGDYTTHSHNVIIDQMRTLGVPGLTAILLLLFSLVAFALNEILVALRARKAAIKDRLLSAALALGVLAYLTANMSSDSFGPTTAPIFWIMVCLCAFRGVALRRFNPAKENVARYGHSAKT